MQQSPSLGTSSLSTAGAGVGRPVPRMRLEGFEVVTTPMGMGQGSSKKTGVTGVNYYPVRAASASAASTAAAHSRIGALAMLRQQNQTMQRLYGLEITKNGSSAGGMGFPQSTASCQSSPFLHSSQKMSNHDVLSGIEGSNTTLSTTLTSNSNRGLGLSLSPARLLSPTSTCTNNNSVGGMAPPSSSSSYALPAPHTVFVSGSPMSHDRVVEVKDRDVFRYHNSPHHRNEAGGASAALDEAREERRRRAIRAALEEKEERTKRRKDNAALMNEEETGLLISHHRHPLPNGGLSKRSSSFSSVASDPTETLKSIDVIKPPHALRVPLLSSASPSLAACASDNSSTIRSVRTAGASPTRRTLGQLKMDEHSVGGDTQESNLLLVQSRPATVAGSEIEMFAAAYDRVALQSAQQQHALKVLNAGRRGGEEANPKCGQCEEFATHDETAIGDDDGGESNVFVATDTSSRTATISIPIVEGSIPEDFGIGSAIKRYEKTDETDENPATSADAESDLRRLRSLREMKRRVSAPVYKQEGANNHELFSGSSPQRSKESRGVHSTLLRELNKFIPASEAIPEDSDDSSRRVSPSRLKNSGQQSIANRAKAYDEEIEAEQRYDAGSEFPADDFWSREAKHKKARQKLIEESQQIIEDRIAFEKVVEGLSSGVGRNQQQGGQADDGYRGGTSPMLSSRESRKYVAHAVSLERRIGQVSPSASPRKGRGGINDEGPLVPPRPSSMANSSPSSPPSGSPRKGFFEPSSLGRGPLSQHHRHQQRLSPSTALGETDLRSEFMVVTRDANNAYRPMPVLPQNFRVCAPDFDDQTSHRLWPLEDRANIALPGTEEEHGYANVGPIPIPTPNPSANEETANPGGTSGSSKQDSNNEVIPSETTNALVQAEETRNDCGGKTSSEISLAHPVLSVEDGTARTLPAYVYDTEAIMRIGAVKELRRDDKEKEGSGVGLPPRAASIGGGSRARAGVAAERVGRASLPPMALSVGGSLANSLVASRVGSRAGSISLPPANQTSASATVSTPTLTKGQHLSAYTFAPSSRLLAPPPQTQNQISSKKLIPQTSANARPGTTPLGASRLASPSTTHPSASSIRFRPSSGDILTRQYQLRALDKAASEAEEAVESDVGKEEEAALAREKRRRARLAISRNELERLFPNYKPQPLLGGESSSTEPSYRNDDGRRSSALLKGELATPRASSLSFFSSSSSVIVQQHPHAPDRNGVDRIASTCVNEITGENAATRRGIIRDGSAVSNNGSVPTLSLDRPSAQLFAMDQRLRRALETDDSRSHVARKQAEEAATPSPGSYFLDQHNSLKTLKGAHEDKMINEEEGGATANEQRLRSPPTTTPPPFCIPTMGARLATHLSLEERFDSEDRSPFDNNNKTEKKAAHSTTSTTKMMVTHTANNHKTAVPTTEQKRRGETKSTAKSDHDQDKDGHTLVWNFEKLRIRAVSRTMAKHSLRQQGFDVSESEDEVFDEEMDDYFDNNDDHQSQQRYHNRRRSGKQSTCDDDNDDSLSDIGWLQLGGKEKEKGGSYTSSALLPHGEPHPKHLPLPNSTNNAFEGSGTQSLIAREESVSTASSLVVGHGGAIVPIVSALSLASPSQVNHYLNGRSGSPHLTAGPALLGTPKSGRQLGLASAGKINGEDHSKRNSSMYGNTTMSIHHPFGLNPTYQNYNNRKRKQDEAASKNKPSHYLKEKLRELMDQQQSTRTEIPNITIKFYNVSTLDLNEAADESRSFTDEGGSSTERGRAGGGSSSNSPRVLDSGHHQGSLLRNSGARAARYSHYHHSRSQPTVSPEGSGMTSSMTPDRTSIDANDTVGSNATGTAAGGRADGKQHRVQRRPHVGPEACSALWYKDYVPTQDDGSSPNARSTIDEDTTNDKDDVNPQQLTPETIVKKEYQPLAFDPRPRVTSELETYMPPQELHLYQMYCANSNLVIIVRPISSAAPSMYAGNFFVPSKYCDEDGIPLPVHEIPEDLDFDEVMSFTTSTCRIKGKGIGVSLKSSPYPPIEGFIPINPSLSKTYSEARRKERQLEDNLMRQTDEKKRGNVEDHIKNASDKISMNLLAKIRAQHSMFGAATSVAMKDIEKSLASSKQRLMELVRQYNEESAFTVDKLSVSEKYIDKMNEAQFLGKTTATWRGMDLYYRELNGNELEVERDNEGLPVFYARRGDLLTIYDPHTNELKKGSDAIVKYHEVANVMRRVEILTHKSFVISQESKRILKDPGKAFIIGPDFDGFAYASQMAPEWYDATKSINKEGGGSGRGTGAFNSAQGDYENQGHQQRNGAAEGGHTRSLVGNDGYIALCEDRVHISNVPSMGLVTKKDIDHILEARALTQWKQNHGYECMNTVKTQEISEGSHVAILPTMEVRCLHTFVDILRFYRECWLRGYPLVLNPNWKVVLCNVTKMPIPYGDETSLPIVDDCGLALVTHSITLEGKSYDAVKAEALRISRNLEEQIAVKKAQNPPGTRVIARSTLSNSNVVMQLAVTLAKKALAEKFYAVRRWMLMPPCFVANRRILVDEKLFNKIALPPNTHDDGGAGKRKGAAASTRGALNAGRDIQALMNDSTLELDQSLVGALAATDGLTSMSADNFHMGRGIGEAGSGGFGSFTDGAGNTYYLGGEGTDSQSSLGGGGELARKMYTTVPISEAFERFRESKIRPLLAEFEEACSDFDACYGSDNYEFTKILRSFVEFQTEGDFTGGAAAAVLQGSGEALGEILKPEVVFVRGGTSSGFHASSLASGSRYQSQLNAGGNSSQSHSHPLPFASIHGNGSFSSGTHHVNGLMLTPPQERLGVDVGYSNSPAALRLGGGGNSPSSRPISRGGSLHDTPDKDSGRSAGNLTSGGFFGTIQGLLSQRSKANGISSGVTASALLGAPSSSAVDGGLHPPLSSVSSFSEGSPMFGASVATVAGIGASSLTTQPTANRSRRASLNAGAQPQQPPISFLAVPQVPGVEAFEGHKPSKLLGEAQRGKK